MILVANSPTNAEIGASLRCHSSEHGALPFSVGNIANIERAGAFVDLTTGKIIDAPTDDWGDFTVRWIEEARRTGRRVHYAMLAQAMAKADGQRQPWEMYTHRAAVQIQIQLALFNGTHEARRRKLERDGGWKLAHDGKRWQMVNSGACVAGFWPVDVIGLAENIQYGQ